MVRHGPDRNDTYNSRIRESRVNKVCRTSQLLEAYARIAASIIIMSVIAGRR